MGVLYYLLNLLGKVLAPLLTYVFVYFKGKKEERLEAKVEALEQRIKDNEEAKEILVTVKSMSDDELNSLLK